jgi:hypothetical protein
MKGNKPVSNGSESSGGLYPLGFFAPQTCDCKNLIKGK